MLQAGGQRARQRNNARGAARRCRVGRRARGRIARQKQRQARAVHLSPEAERIRGRERRCQLLARLTRLPHRQVDVERQLQAEREAREHDRLAAEHLPPAHAPVSGQTDRHRGCMCRRPSGSAHSCAISARQSAKCPRCAATALCANALAANYACKRGLGTKRQGQRDTQQHIQKPTHASSTAYTRCRSENGARG